MSTNTKLAEALRLAKEYADDEDWSRVKGCINLALAAHDAEQAVPAGWKLVPAEPTPEMLAAIWAYKLDSLKDCYRALLAAAPRPGAVAGWQPIETAPKDGRKMLLFYLNANGQARRVIGGWVTAEEAAETDADDVGLEAGWYERIDNWPDYYQVAINEGEPTHWMPLPAAPQPEGSHQ